MTTSLGICGARQGDSRCPGEVVVDREGDSYVEGSCNLCGMEYASPLRSPRGPEPEKDWTETEEPWWNH